MFMQYSFELDLMSRKFDLVVRFRQSLRNKRFFHKKKSSQNPQVILTINFEDLFDNMALSKILHISFLYFTNIIVKDIKNAKYMNIYILRG